MNKFDIESKIFSLAPWIAPLIPAYFAVDHAKKYLLTGGGLDSYFVWVVGLTVELVGMAAVHTTLEFWQWNKEKGVNSAPVWLSAFTALFYVVTVITVNAVLELYTGVSIRVFAKALLSLLTLPSALVIGMRALHKRRIAEHEALRVEENAERERLRLERKAERERRTSEANEQRTPNARTPEQPRRTNTRTPNIPQPANEQKFRPFPNAEQDAKRTRIEQTAEQLQANNITPSVRNIQRVLRLQDFQATNGRRPTDEEERTLTGWSTSTISEHLKGKA